MLPEVWRLTLGPTMHTSIGLCKKMQELSWYRYGEKN